MGASVEEALRKIEQRLMKRLEFLYQRKAHLEGELASIRRAVRFLGK
jgi:hypothetical protein